MASTPFPFPADRVQVYKQTRDDDAGWMVYQKAKDSDSSGGTGRKSKKNSNATFLSYSHLDMTPLPVKIKSRKRRAVPPVVPPRSSGASGPEGRGDPMETDDSYEKLSVASYNVIDEHSSTEMPSQLELLAMADDEVPEEAAQFEPLDQARPGTFGPVVIDLEKEQTFRMLTPYPGMVVDLKTKRLLSRMDRDEISQLLKPLSEAEPDTDGTRRVFED